MSDKPKIISADDLDFMNGARAQVNQAAKNLEAAKAAQVFVEQRISVKYGIGATDSLNLDTGEIVKAVSENEKKKR